MCRSNLYFKGMGKVVDRWEDEAHEKKWEEVYTDAIEETFGEFQQNYTFFDPRSIMLYLQDLDEAYAKLRELERKHGIMFGWEEIREILRHPYCIRHIIISGKKYYIWDDYEEISKRNLFVSNYPSWNGPSIVRAV